MKYVICTLILLVASCASVRESALFPIRYEFSDSPSEHRIVIRFTNDFAYPVCLLPEHWPNPAGKINQASDEVYLMIEEKRFPIVDFNTGYCPAGCSLRVDPDGVVTASIPYEDFKIPKSLFDSRKELVFSPKAYRCK